MLKLHLLVLSLCFSVITFGQDAPWIVYSDDVFQVIEGLDKVRTVKYIGNEPATVFSMDAEIGKFYNPGRQIAVLNIPKMSKANLTLREAHQISKINIATGQEIKCNDTLFEMTTGIISHGAKNGSSGVNKVGDLKTLLVNLWHDTGIYAILTEGSNDWTLGVGKVLMIIVGITLLGLAVFKDFEPLLLVPIGFGAILSNIHLAGISGPDGLLGLIYNMGVETGAFPLLIFMGVGAMTDFGPMIANPRTSLLGGAAQLGIFVALMGAVALGHYFPEINFDFKAAASIGIIGGADGPTAIYVTTKLAPNLLGSIAVAAYSYMALVPIIQPPIMRLLTTVEERKIKMVQTRHVSKLEKIVFPLVIIIMSWLLLPSAAPLIGFLMFGNFMRECGVVERLSNTAQNALINVVTIMLGLSVGSKLSADKFLNIQTLGILALGLMAFCIGTAGGVLLAKFFNKVFKWNINPLIGSAGVSAVPMAARVSNKVGLESDPHNFLLMHAMGPNVAGVIGSAVAAGVLLSALKF